MSDHFNIIETCYLVQGFKCVIYKAQSIHTFAHRFPSTLTECHHPIYCSFALQSALVITDLLNIYSIVILELQLE